MIAEQRAMPADPRAAAEDLIRRYVHRGDTEESIRSGHMGSYSDRYHAGIGDYADGIAHLPTQIVVTKVGGKPVVPAAVFSLHEVYKALKREVDGSALQGRLL